MSLVRGTRFFLQVGCAVVLMLVAAPRAGAQTFISPFLGYNFGGDAGCPEVSNCEDKKSNIGIALGTAGFIGFEEELAYAKNFFGDTPGLSSSVLTLMSNVMIAPRIGPTRPYVLIGVGLIKSRTEANLGSLIETNNNNFGWDMGGGLMLMFGHIGVRGDLRYFHAFQDVEFLGVPISDLKLDFGRASAGVVFEF
jgi:opacity protein-like surface antigen